MDDTTQFLNKKKDLIANISNQLKSWDNTVEHAMEILEINNENFQKLQVIDKKIPDDILEEFNAKINTHWLELLSIHQNLMQVIQENQREIQKQLVQINNKEKVVSNYMSLQNKSIFIESDY